MVSRAEPRVTRAAPLVVGPRDCGAICDGRTLGRADILKQDYAGALVSAPSDCTMTAGSAVLTCSSTVPFTAADVGKVIAVYGAGPTVTGHLVPLATTIAGYQSAGQVTLATPAATSVTASEHVVWGTNDDVAMQAAVDALADRGGGVLQSPPGTCLTRGIVLPCADIGDFRRAGYLECRRRYHYIHVKGVSRTRSRWENWDPHASVDPLRGHIAMVALGFGAKIPGAGGNAPPGRLRNIEVSVCRSGCRSTPPRGCRTARSPRAPSTGSSSTTPRSTHTTASAITLAAARRR